MTKGKIPIVLMCCLIFLSALFPLSMAEEDGRNGIEMENAGLLLEDLQVGRTYCLSNVDDNPNVIKVIARNNLSEGVYFNLTFHQPSEAEYYQKLMSGYEDIPDPRWVSTDQSRKWCPAGSQVEYEIWISIPNDEQYDDKRYQVTMYLENEAPEGSNINMAIFGRLQLVTMEAQDVVTTTTLTVKVMNSTTQVQVKDELNVPIPECSVTLIGSNGTSNAYTDSDGNAYFDIALLGDYQIEVAKDGYEEYEKPVQIESDGNTTLMVELMKSDSGMGSMMYIIGAIAIVAVMGVAVVAMARKK